MTEKVRGRCGFSSLLKPKKKGKTYLVIYIAGFFFKKKFCKERPANHYLHPTLYET
jgi:hypothetical protein